MQKIFILIGLVLSISFSVYADNKERITELQAESQKFVAVIKQRQEAIQKLQVGIIQNNAIISELTKQDKEEKASLEADVTPEE